MGNAKRPEAIGPYGEQDQGTVAAVEEFINWQAQKQTQEPELPSNLDREKWERAKDLVMKALNEFEYEEKDKSYRGIAGMVQNTTAQV